MADPQREFESRISSYMQTEFPALDKACNERVTKKGFEQVLPANMLSHIIFSWSHPGEANQSYAISTPGLLMQSKAVFEKAIHSLGFDKNSTLELTAEITRANALGNALAARMLAKDITGTFAEKVDAIHPRLETEEAERRLDDIKLQLEVKPEIKLNLGDTKLDGVSPLMVSAGQTDLSEGRA